MTAGQMLDYLIVGVLGAGVLVALVVGAVWRLDHPRPRRQPAPRGRREWIWSLIGVAVIALTQSRIVGSVAAGQRPWVVLGISAALALGLVAGELRRIDLRARADDPVNRHRLTGAGVLAIGTGGTALAVYLATISLDTAGFRMVLVTFAVLAAVPLLTLAAAHAWRRIRPGRFAPRGD